MRTRSSGSAKVFYRRSDRDDIEKRLRDGLGDLRAALPVTRVVFFGSAAANRHTPASDIDLLVVYAGAPRSDAFAVVRKALGLPGLEPHVYTEEEAKACGDTLVRMTRNGILIL